mmetsp:Transcript_26828/g.44543  ORF Transcript_26828/g.44543 Transcript_26828/m.44543 type:complete len:245 (-) Transcript_26828:133-867(-)
MMASAVTGVPLTISLSWLFALLESRTRGFLPKRFVPVACSMRGMPTKKITATTRAVLVLRPIIAFVVGQCAARNSQRDARADEPIRQLLPVARGSSPLLSGMNPPPQPPSRPAMSGPITVARSWDGCARLAGSVAAASAAQFISTWQRWISYSTEFSTLPSVVSRRNPSVRTGMRYTTTHVTRHTGTSASLHMNGTGLPHIIAAMVEPPKHDRTMRAQPCEKFIFGCAVRMARALAAQKPTSVT